MSDWIHTRNGQIFLRNLGRLADGVDRLADEVEEFNRRTRVWQEEISKHETEQREGNDD